MDFPKHLLKELISIDTVNSKNAELVGKLISDYLSMNPTVIGERVKNYLFIKGESKELWLWCGHYDVVPDNGWKDAFIPREEGEFIYGRGSSDMKGGLTSLVEAFRSIKVGQGISVALAIVGDEEKGGLEGIKVVKDWLEERGYRVRYYLGAEPMQCDSFLCEIKVGRRGIAQFKIKLLGEGGHASVPQKVKSPVHSLPKVLEELRNIRFNDAEDMIPTTVAVTKVSCESNAFNVIPSQCEIWLDVRFNYNVSLESIEKRLKEVLSKHWDDYSIESIPLPNPVAFRNKDKIYEALAIESVKEVTGSEPKPSTTGGSSDARYFPHSAVEIGPRAFNIHGRNEKVSLEDLKKLVDIYLKLYGKLTSAKAVKRD